MARQLERDGEQVEFLGLINPSEPIQTSALRAAFERVRRVIGRGAGGRQTCTCGPGTRSGTFTGACGREEAGCEDFGKLLEIEPRLEAMFPPREALYKDYVGVFNWVAAGYRTGIFSGKITFYWAREEPAIAQSWQPVIRCKEAAHSEEHEVAGGIMSSVTDHIQGIAEILSECLSRVEQEARRREQYERPEAS